MTQKRLSAAFPHCFFPAVLVALFALVPVAPAARAATYTVTTTADTISGSCAPSSCSLRDAVIAANASPGMDTIVVPEGTYTLTIPGVGEDASATGDLDLTDDVEIQGMSLENTIIDGNGIDRVLHVLPGVTANVTNLNAWGAGGRDDGSQSTLGGIYVQQGTLNLTRCRVSGHIAGLWLDQGELTATDSLVSDNRTQGISVTGGTLTLTNSTVSDTGGSFLEATVFGISASSATVVLRNSTVTENGNWFGMHSVGYGIAIESSSTLLLDTSTVCWNGSDEFGAGIRVAEGSSSATVVDSTICQNAPCDLESSGDVSVTNSTVESGEGYSLASLVNYGQMSLRNSTVTGVDSVWFPAIYNKARLTVANTIVTGGCVSSGGTLQTNGGNLESPGNSCGLSDPTDQVGVPDPVLGALADNGGPTMTRALLLGSPAIDKGLAASCPATDQRGVPRPQGSACDVGAFESCPGLWSGAGDLGSGWRWLDWLGFFNVNSEPWIYHEQLEWMYVSGTSTASLWIYYPKMAAWLWTSDALFPSFYRVTGPVPAWIRYQEWTTSPAWFYNQTSNEWESY